MKKFAGKYSLILGARKLVFWEQRLGLIGRDRTTIRKDGGAHVPLPPEACMFLAIDRGDGTFVLQACNGELVAFNTGTELHIAGTYPTVNRLYPVQVSVAHFDLALFRAGRRKDGKARLSYYIEYFGSGKRRNLGMKRSPNIDVDEISSARYLTNMQDVVEDTAPNLLWDVVTLGDDPADFIESKKVSHFDFRSAGSAVIDVSGENYRGVDFGRADFSGANLAGTVMTATIHDGSRFCGSNLDGASFFGSSIRDLNLAKASMKGAVLSNMNGRGCDFSDCDLRDVVCATPLELESTEASPLKFSRAKLNYPLIGKNWHRKALDKARIFQLPARVDDLDARLANLTEVSLVGLKGSRAKFDNAIMHGVKLHDAALPGASFLAAQLDTTVGALQADLTAADLQGAKFDNANLSGASFEGARLDEATFTAATINQTVFANAYLMAVSFAGVEQKMMTGANFSRAFLVGCNFTGTDLSTHDRITVNLSEAYLQGADFTGANLAGATLSGAGMATEEGELTVTIGGITLPVTYEPTVIDGEAITSKATTCPNGEAGPCSVEDLVARRFPTVWPWPGRRKSARLLKKERR